MQHDVSPVTRHSACFKAGGMCMKTENGFYCTLPRKHHGAHIAHGLSCRIEYTWPQHSIEVTKEQYR